MSNYPFALSRKIVYSIKSELDRFKDGSFTEIDLKALLIDLRELAKHIRNEFREESDEFTKSLGEFIDVCDFIAHGVRERGIVEKNVRAYAKKLYANQGLPLHDSLALEIDNALDTNKLVGTMSALAYFAISKSNIALSRENIDDILESHGNDIAICFLSLMQDAKIKLEEEEGVAFLQLMHYKGFYRVYCRLIDSRMERETKDRTGGSGQIVLGFPVMTSSVKCEDEHFLSKDFTAFPPMLFETYRNNSRLKLRQIG